MGRICIDCKKHKGFEHFSKDSTTSTGYKNVCKLCASRRYSIWREKNIEAQRIREKVSQYKSHYGLTEEEAQWLVGNGRVGICECCFQEGELVVDHDHTTGKVRGYICSPCNSMLGYARDDALNLQLGHMYLKRTKGEQDGDA